MTVGFWEMIGSHSRAYATEYSYPRRPGQSTVMPVQGLCHQSERTHDDLSPARIESQSPRIRYRLAGWRFRRQAIGFDVQCVWRKERVIRILLTVIYKLVIAFRHVRRGQAEKRIRPPRPKDSSNTRSAEPTVLPHPLIRAGTTPRGSQGGFVVLRHLQRFSLRFPAGLVNSPHYISSHLVNSFPIRFSGSIVNVHKFNDASRFHDPSASWQRIPSSRRTPTQIANGTSVFFTEVQIVGCSAQHVVVALPAAAAILA